MIRGEIMNDKIKETLEYKINFLTKSLNIGIQTKERRYFDDIKEYISNLELKNNKLGFENIMLKMENNVYKQGYEELKELIEKLITEVKND